MVSVHTIHLTDETGDGDLSSAAIHLIRMPFPNRVIKGSFLHRLVVPSMDTDTSGADALGGFFQSRMLLRTVEMRSFSKPLILDETYAGCLIFLDGTFGHIEITGEPMGIWLHDEGEVDHLRIAEGITRTRVGQGAGANFNRITAPSIPRFARQEQEPLHNEPEPERRRSSQDRNQIPPAEDPPETAEPDPPADPGPDEGEDPPGAPDDEDDGQDPAYEPVLFAGGVGTESDPYQLNNPAHLVFLSSFHPDQGVDTGEWPESVEQDHYELDLLKAHYVMTDDIDLGGVHMTPIGSAAHYFNGVFDGDGKTIDNLTIELLIGIYENGLFAGIGMDGQVQNLTITNPEINACLPAGVLAGVNHGNISHVLVYGTDVNGKSHVVGDSHNLRKALGGLVGVNRRDGVISQCRVDLLIETTAQEIGMVAGNNQGIIDQCVAMGRIVEASTRQGGLVGLNKGGAVTDSYSTTTLFGANTHRGGLVGRIEKSTVGEVDTLGSIENSYSEGIIQSTTSQLVGGLIGSMEDGPTIQNSFFSIAVTEGQGNSIGIGLTEEDIGLQSTFQTYGWDFDSVWYWDEGINRPRLQWLRDWEESRNER